MYKVVIIDDEDLIVEGLKKVMEWEKYGCEVVATAYDAASGAEAIRNFKPNIVFTDISMPDMDGLTMLAGLKSEFPTMQITVLTGYRYFEYAKRAIELGVCRFLLKPSKMDELNEALATMIKRLTDYGIAEKKIEQAENEEEITSENANSFIVRTALKYIETHYTEKLTLSELAEKTYVSKCYLSKLLNKYTNQGFNDLLNQSRINRAKELLQDPSLKIHEISDILGFNDVTHFSKTFKKIELVSPNEFRNLK